MARTQRQSVQAVGARIRRWRRYSRELERASTDRETGSSFRALEIKAERTIPSIAALLRHGARVDDKRETVQMTDGGRATVLHYAAKAGVVKTIEVLLDHGADPNFRDDNGLTPLDWLARASKSFDRDAVRPLIPSAASAVRAERSVTMTPGSPPAAQIADHVSSWPRLFRQQEHPLGAEAIEGIGCRPCRWSAMRRRADMPSRDFLASLHRPFGVASFD